MFQALSHQPQQAHSHPTVPSHQHTPRTYLLHIHLPPILQTGPHQFLQLAVLLMIMYVKV